MKIRGIFKFLILILAVFFTVEVLFLISPVIISKFVPKQKITEIFAKQTDEILDYENISLKTYPDFSILIKIQKPEIKGILSADNLEFKTGLSKIIFKKIILKDFKTNNFKLYIVRNPDNTTNLDNLFKNPYTLEYDKLNADITKYKVFATDKTVNQNTQILGDKILIKISKNDIFADFDGNISGQGEKADLKLQINMPKPDAKKGFKNTKKYFLMTGYIKNFHPQIFKEYIKTYIDKDLSEMSGVINAEFKPQTVNGKIKSVDIDLQADNFKMLSRIKEKSIIFGEKDIIKSKIIIDGDTLSVDDFEFSGDKFKILMKGKINQWGSKSPKVDFDINIDNARVEELYWMLPSNLFTEEREILKTKKYGAYGDAKGNIQFKGNLMLPEVYGSVDFKNVWVLDGLPPEVPKATVKIGFRKDKVDVDVKVWASKNEYVTVKGWSDFFDLSKNEYQINSTDNVPLATAEKILVPVSDTVGFIIGPVPIMDITGFGNIDLYVSGSEEEPYLKGAFNFNDASASFNGINLKLEKASGSVDFKEDKTYFHNDKGFIWGKPAIIKGVSDSGINVDYKAEVKNVNLKDIINALKTSPMLKEQVKPVEVIDSADGIADLRINVLGKIDMANIKKAMGEDAINYFTPNGELIIKNGSLKIKNPSLILSKMNGLVKFDTENITPDLDANLYDSKLKIKGLIGKKSNLQVDSQNMKLKDSIKLLLGADVVKEKDFSATTVFKMSLGYSGDMSNVDYEKISLKAQFPTKQKSDSFIDVLSGSINLNNGKLNLKNLNTKFYNTTAKADGSVSNLFKSPLVTGDFSIFKLDLSLIDKIKNSEIIPQKYGKILDAYKDYKGDLSAKFNIRNNNINGNVWLRDISFAHSVLDYPFSVKSADFIFKNSNLDINSFNASFAGTPVFLNGTVKNIIKNPDFNIYFTSKLSENFVDNYINTYLSYPLKVTGEILLSSRIAGNSKEINIYPSIKLEEGADISYMGANLGDENSIRELKGDFKKQKDKFLIKNLDYSKYIYSQNNKLYPLPLVNLKSETRFIKNKLYIDNLDLKTHNPINANIFNAFFKKSLIKNGQMVCNLNIKGYADKPKILGTLDLKNIQIPSYETTIENLKADFNPKEINVKSKAGYLGSDIDVMAKIRNNYFDILHFDNLEIHIRRLNLDWLLNSLNEISYSRPIQIVGNHTQNEELPFDIKKILIDKGRWNIDEISYKTIPVSNFSGNLTYKNNMLRLNDVLLDLAGGKVKGDFGYDVKKAVIYAKAEADDVDANEIAYGLLDIKNQIYGKLDGKVDITTLGATDEERLQNLNGDLSFSVNDGKMPKLGSIEYLLRAGNLIKSGISGLTLNNITSILLPVQNGGFDTIKGEIQLNKGIAENIKIYSKGQNLSILLTGNYNLTSSEADIYVLGKLSKDIDNILGPVGNASLNSFFNLIPGVHLDEAKDTDLIKQINSIPELGLPAKKFRIFRAKVDGDINSDKFVSMFEWLDK